jgi:hypothetical protein
MMAKDEKEQTSMASLNEVYDSILGKGTPLDGTGGKSAGRDTAYDDEDYSDDSGEGIDPREDDSTEEEDAKDSTEDQTEDELLDDDSDDQEEDSGEEPIDDRLVEAGRRANLSDEEIVELAETKPSVLEALAKAQESAARISQPNGEERPPVEPKKKAGEGKLKKLELDLSDADELDFSPKAKEVIEQLVKHVNELTGTLESHDKNFEVVQEQTRREGSRRIDAFFDEAAKAMPLLGNSQKLDSKHKEARLFAWRVAMGTQQAYGGKLSDEEALTIGVNALKGQLTETQVKSKIVSDLNKNKNRFIARPKGRRPIQGGQSKSAEDRAMDAINRIMDDPKYR